MRLLLIFFASCFFSEAKAYLDYAPNAHIQEEVEAHPYRILPHSNNLFVTLDADFFKPVFAGGDNNPYYKYDYYHGNGYWLDLRAEFKPFQDFVINVKTDLTHGTSSNGPTYLALIIPHVGMTYRQHGFLGFDWEARLSDIDRQTIGTGLFIEDKETDGGYLIGKQGIFTGKVMVDGTGSFQLAGGVVAGEATLWDGLLGLSGFVQETDTPFHPPALMATIFSKKDWDTGLGYGVEFGGDNMALAGMVYGKYEGSMDRLHVFLKPQIRAYGHQILGNLPGQVQQNYVSYDQNDKPYTNLMDIFVYGDDVTTYSTQLNLEYTFNIFYRVFIETEFVDYQYHLNTSEFKQLFYRTGVKFSPFKNRPEEFGFLVGNKYLIASTADGNGDGGRTFSQPNTPDLENKPLFMNQFYFMFNFSTKM